MSQVDEILDTVFASAVKHTELCKEGKGANTIVSDAMWKAKQELKSLLLSKAVDYKVKRYKGMELKPREVTVKAIPIEAINRLFDND